MIADELRRQADVFTDLVELQSNLARDPSGRPAEPHLAPRFPHCMMLRFPRAGDRDDKSQALCGLCYPADEDPVFSPKFPPMSVAGLVV